jgi:hypothetical protein
MAYQAVADEMDGVRDTVLNPQRALPAGTLARWARGR